MGKLTESENIASARRNPDLLIFPNEIYGKPVRTFLQREEYSISTYNNNRAEGALRW